MRAWGVSYGGRYDAFFDGDAVYMALEFMDMGTLSTMIQVRPVYAHSVGLMDTGAGGGSPALDKRWRVGFRSRAQCPMRFVRVSPSLDAAVRNIRS